MAPANKLNIQDIYYVDVLLAEANDADLLMGIVHGFNASQGEHLGVDFPEWNGDTPNASVKRVRLFGSHRLLSALTQQRYFQRLALLGGSDLAVKSVPTSKGFCRIGRANSFSRNTKSYHERMKKRAASRGEEYSRIVKDSHHAPVLDVSYRSVSTGQVFKMKLKKEMMKAPSTHVVFTSYGLCLEGGIPVF